MNGLALEGGGAKGAYQVGAYLALVNNGIKFNWIAGTSIGALNAALMIQNKPEKMIDLWLNTTTDIIGINSNLITKIKKKQISFEDLKSGFNNLKKIFKNKGIDTKPFLDVICQNIDEKKIRNKKTKFGLVTLKLKKMTPMEITIDDIPEGKLSEYIMASCYLPFFSFKKIIDGEYYLDGGFYNNLPLQFLENQGCETIYAIRLNSPGFKHNKLKKSTKVIEIKPKKSLGSMILFDKDSCLLNMRRGFYDALRVVKNLDGDNYYFYHQSDQYYERIIRKAPQELIIKLKKKYKAKTNKELVIKVVEHLLEKAEIEHLSLYNIKKKIKYLKKDDSLKKPYKEFIISCKTFW